MTISYVGLGGNLGDRADALQEALNRLASFPGLSLTALSCIYETSPVDGAEGGPFLNAVVRVATELSAKDLLEALMRVERAMGRTRPAARTAARIIDLDLLLYGDSVILLPGLAVPHLRLTDRLFALLPLADLAPNLMVPGTGKKVCELAAEAVRLHPEQETAALGHFLVLP